MTNNRIEHRPIRDWLTEWLKKEYEMAMRKLNENDFIRKVARYFTASILICTVLVSVGILINRGLICYTK